MTTERIKEIQSKTACPESVSVQQALLQVWNEVKQEQLRLQNVMRCVCCGNTEGFTDGAKQQILIDDEYRYIYAVTCNECGKVCDVELFD